MNETKIYNQSGQKVYIIVKGLLLPRGLKSFSVLGNVLDGNQKGKQKRENKYRVISFPVVTVFRTSYLHRQFLIVLTILVDYRII